jgi:amino acid transporter
VIARTWGATAAGAVTLAVLVTAFASTYAGLLSGSRVPYAGARDGLFFAPFARLHPTGRFPHVSLLVMGLVTVPFCFLSLGDAIAWLTTAGVLIQSIAQVAALFALRARGDRSPYRMWLYPVPALAALVAWGWVFLAAGTVAIAFGIATLATGAIVYLIVAKRDATWPFAAVPGTR